jgi:hypothetical protein
VPGAAWPWGDDNNVAADNLRTAGTTLLYLCLPALRFSEVGASYFPIIEMKKTYQIQGLYIRGTCLVLLNK